MYKYEKRVAQLRATLFFHSVTCFLFGINTVKINAKTVRKKKMHLLLKDAIVVREEKRAIISIDILAASIIGIIMWWLTEGVHFSSEYIAEQIIAMNR